MAYRGGEGGGSTGGLGPMSGVVMVMIGLVVVVAIMQFAPTIGGSIYNAQPTLGTTNPWNATYNTNLPSATTFYTNNVQLESSMG